MNIKLKIITPLLMHGVDGKTPELRESEFKGMMRFWFRAIHSNLSLNNLKQKEADIFGDTTKKSSFRMKIVSENLERDKFLVLNYKDLVKQELKNKKLDENKKKKMLKKYDITKSDGFKVGECFEIEFIGENLENVKNIFILSTILGGFGQRNRRGFGSLEIIEIDKKKFTFETNKDSILELIKKINPNFKERYSANAEKYPYIIKIEISSKKDKDYNNLLKQIGYAAHKYKHKCLGDVNPRYASPVYVSLIREDEYFPIVTTLYHKYICISKIEGFKRDIL